jgi:hypothetical protein
MENPEDEITPPREMLYKEYFDYDDILRKTAKELIKFTQIDERYLNKEKMEKDIYDYLKTDIIKGDLIHWNYLISNPNRLRDIINFKNIGIFCLYYNFILGIKNSYNNKTLTITKSETNKDINNIKVILTNAVKEIMDRYKELVEDREKRRL